MRLEARPDLAAVDLAQRQRERHAIEAPRGGERPCVGGVGIVVGGVGRTFGVGVGGDVSRTFGVDVGDSVSRTFRGGDSVSRTFCVGD